MPPKSEAQRRLMQAAAHNPKVAARTGVPQKVAREYAEADQGGKLPERAERRSGKKGK